MLKGVLFDLDDTLYPELEYVFSGYAAVAGWSADRFAIPAAQGHRELVDFFRSGTRYHIFNHWLARYDLDSEENALQLLKVYREHMPSIRLFSGVLELLARLRSRYRLGIVSDGYLVMQTQKVAALDVEPLVETVVLSDRLGADAWKPSPKPFQLALANLGLSPEQAVYVGDNPHKDFLGARRAGMRSIRVLRFGGLYSEVEPPGAEHEPDTTIFALSELEAELEEYARAGANPVTLTLGA